MDQTFHTEYQAPMGTLTLIATEDALVGLHWPGQKLRTHFAEPGIAVVGSEHPVLARAMDELARYFADARETLTVPLAPRGSSFECDVWNILQEIPHGNTTTYGAIAKHLGNAHLAQRVGQAVGANPIGLIIPCHRVLGADGSLTGFSGGIATKRWLLSHEEPDAQEIGRLF